MDLLRESALYNDRLAQQYQAVKVLGLGASSFVYLCDDLLQKRKVAIKMIASKQDEGKINNAMREADILRTLNHENIVRLLDFVTDNNDFFFIFEYFELDFKNYIRTSPDALRDSEVIKGYLKQILEGVAYCHQQGVLHRDLKPQNLLMDRKENKLKLADFGLSKVILNNEGELTDQIGTVRYMAPEMILGSNSYSYSLDMWGVGCIFAEMVLKSVLFEGDNPLLVIMEIFQMFGGVPTEAEWEGVTRLRFYDIYTLMFGSRERPKLSLRRKVPHLEADGFNLLSKLLVVSPAKRISAEDALLHEYFMGTKRGGDRERGGFGRGFGRGGDRGRRFRRQVDEEKWVPVTKLGRLVKAGKIRSLEQIYLHSLAVKEHQIIDTLLGPVLKYEVLKIMTVQKQTRAGQRTRYKAFVVVGDSNGHVGLGVKCSKERATAISGGINLAKLSVIPVRRGYWGKEEKIGKPHTVPCKVTGKCGSVTMRLIPAPRGAGIVAARVPKKVLLFAGIEDVFTSSGGSTKTLGNFVMATFISLQKTYRFFTPDLWRETRLPNTPFQEYTDDLLITQRK